MLALEENIFGPFPGDSLLYAAMGGWSSGDLLGEPPLLLLSLLCPFTFFPEKSTSRCCLSSLLTGCSSGCSQPVRLCSSSALEPDGRLFNTRGHADAISLRRSEYMFRCSPSAAAVDVLGVASACVDCTALIGDPDVVDGLAGGPRGPQTRSQRCLECARTHETCTSR